jgi:polysaccharide export outer membrane protein
MHRPSSHDPLGGVSSRVRACAVLVACATTLAAAAAPLRAQSGAPLSTPTAAARVAPVQVGDLVRVTVWRRPELSGEFRVGQDGTLRHPLYQQVRIAGLGIVEAQGRLQEYLRTLEAAPQVVLEPVLRVSVGGEIRSPNLYSLSPETSVAQVIALAGGPTERGRLDRVRLVRGGEVTMLDLTSTARAVTETPVQSGDQLFLERRRAVFREVVLPTLSVLGSVAALATLFIAR